MTPPVRCRANFGRWLECEPSNASRLTAMGALQSLSGEFILTYPLPVSLAADVPPLAADRKRPPAAPVLSLAPRAGQHLTSAPPAIAAPGRPGLHVTRPAAWADTRSHGPRTDAVS